MNRECPLVVVVSGPSVARSSDSPAGMTSCLGVCFAVGADLRAPSPEAVRGVRARPLVTAILRPF